MSRLLALFLNLVSESASAQTVDCTGDGGCFISGMSAWNVTGAPQSFSGLVARITGVLLNSVTAIAAAIFLTGAMLFGASFGKEDLKNLGKEMMIGAIIGLFFVIAARGIMGIVLYFVYYGPGGI